MHQDRLGLSVWKASFQRRTLRSWWTRKLVHGSSVFLQQSRQLIFSLCSTLVRHIWDAAVLGSSGQDRYGFTDVSSVQDHKSHEGT